MVLDFFRRLFGQKETTSPKEIKEFLGRILAHEKYLKRLLTSDGQGNKWSHLFNVGADNIDKPIDVYKIIDSRGVEKDSIYISSYHPSMSNLAPKGYKFK